MSFELKPLKNIQRFFMPVLVLFAIGLAFFSGTLWQKVKSLEKGGTTAGIQTTQAAPTQTPITISQIKDLFSKDVIKFGDANKKVLFVEISDPSCPYCHVAGGLDPEINNQMGGNFKLVSEGGAYVAPVPEIKKLIDVGKASFVYIYSPGHGNGEMGMKALYCANEKGKFWDADSLIMTNSGYNLLNNTIKNDKTQSQALADFLKSAVDPTFLKSCLDSGKYDARLQSDIQLATTLNYQGTPDFYVNASNFPGAYSWTDMKSSVDAALK